MSTFLLYLLLILPSVKGTLTAVLGISIAALIVFSGTSHYNCIRQIKCRGANSKDLEAGLEVCAVAARSICFGSVHSYLANHLCTDRLGARWVRRVCFIRRLTPQVR